MKKQLTTLVLATISISSLNGCITQPMDKKLLDWAYNKPEPTISQEDKSRDYQEKEQVAYLIESSL
ncbi:hypothetical protein HYW74_03130 [Candidatus Pacearchaeota archaeon]|nr:hypothetical protein [Candidatus Pacearchaeota archaeon]